MKRILNFVTLVITMATVATAEPVSIDSAQSIATRVLSFSHPASGKRLAKGITPQVQQLKVPSLEGSDKEHPAFYVFTRTNGKGFAIIAGDDTMTPLIGYSLDGTFSTDSLPCALETLLHRISAHRSPSRKVGPLEPGNVLVEPYLKTTWDQDEPYSWLTSTYTFENKYIMHYPTGCVPTATAQVMKYYQWPTTSYYRRYDWDHMKNNYKYYTRTEGMAVATLMRDLGRIMGTIYTESASSTYYNALYSIPGYKCTELSSVNDCKEYIGKGPLLIAISGGMNHAVVIDGLDDQDYFHVNWGWGGSCDGYYVLTDMAIEWRDSEIHPRMILGYYMEPDAEVAPVTLVASEGVTVDRAKASVGDEVKVTMHGVTQLSRKPFNGYIGVCVTSNKESEAGNYYSFTLGKNGKQGFAKNNVFSDCRVHWDSSHDGEDVTITINMQNVGDEGTYYLVPISCDESEGTGDNMNDYHQWVHIADGATPDDVPFSWNGHTAEFTQSVSEDIRVSADIITASTYRQGGESQIVARAVNDGSTDFNGTLTLTLAPADGKGTVKTMDMDFYAPAGPAQYITLATQFDFTGTYRITRYELSRTNLAGVKTTYANADYDGVPFGVYPTTADVDDSFIISTYSMINENMYASEEKDEVWVYLRGEYGKIIHTDNVVMEFVAMPIAGGRQQNMGRFTWEKEDGVNQTSNLKLNARNLTPGSYVVVGFMQIGNTTRLLVESSNLNQRIINVLDPGIEIPTLKILSYKPLGTCYKGQYNTVALQVENTDDVDFVGEASLPWSYSEQNTHMTVVGTFCVRAHDQGTIFLRFKKYNDTGKQGKEALSYVMTTNDTKFNVAFDGERNIVLDFEEKPEDNPTTFCDALFYFKDDPMVEYIPSKLVSTVKRTIYRDDKAVLSLPEISVGQWDAIQPALDDIKDLPQGAYWMKAEFTLASDASKQTRIYPIYLTDGVPAFVFNAVKFVLSHDLTVADDLPFHVKVTNVSDKALTVTGTYELSKYENYYLSADETRRFAVNVPSGKYLTIPMTVRVTREAQKSDGLFRLQVAINRFGGTGMLSNIQNSTSITLPFKSTGIEEVATDTERIPVAYYDLQGRRLNRPLQGGINIVKYDDGSYGKIFLP